MENGPVEIVDFPIVSMVTFSSYVELPVISPSHFWTNEVPLEDPPRVPWVPWGWNMLEESQFLDASLMWRCMKPSKLRRDLGWIQHIAVESRPEFVRMFLYTRREGTQLPFNYVCSQSVFSFPAIPLTPQRHGAASIGIIGRWVSPPKMQWIPCVPSCSTCRTGKIWEGASPWS